jgi:sorbitol-specific phosphotransferase system component IIBC
MDLIGIIMSAGKSSVDVALYTLLPIMVVMLMIMKYLEVRGYWTLSSAGSRRCSNLLALAG